MAFFGTFLFGEELFGTGSSGPGPTPGAPLVRVPWVLQAVNDPDVYEFAVNPLDAQMPAIQKTLTVQKTASGKDVIFQGRDQVQTMSFSGTILTEAHYEKMNEWFHKEKQVSITDDLGRQYWVYLTSFNPTRDYRPEYPWKFEYSADASILSWGQTRTRDVNPIGSFRTSVFNFSHTFTEENYAFQIPYNELLSSQPAAIMYVTVTFEIIDDAGGLIMVGYPIMREGIDGSELTLDTSTLTIPVTNGGGYLGDPDIPSPIFESDSPQTYTCSLVNNVLDGREFFLYYTAFNPIAGIISGTIDYEISVRWAPFV